MLVCRIHRLVKHDGSWTLDERSQRTPPDALQHEKGFEDEVIGVRQGG